MPCKINSQVSSRLKQLPLNLKIKKEVVLQVLTAVRRNGKRQKKEGMMLSDGSRSPGREWPSAAGTLEPWLHIPTAHPVQTPLPVSLWQVSHTTSVAELSTPTCLFAVWHTPGCTMEKHFLCLVFFFSPFLSGALRTCHPETHSSVQCAMSGFYCLCVDFTASSHSQLQSSCLGNRCIPLIAPPWYGWAWWGEKELLLLVIILRRHSVLPCTAPGSGLFLNAAVASCEGATTDWITRMTLFISICVTSIISMTVIQCINLKTVSLLYWRSQQTCLC